MKCLFIASVLIGFQLASQHPYTEDFVAEPHVYTVDIGNLTEVEAVVEKALQMIDDKKVLMDLVQFLSLATMLLGLYGWTFISKTVFTVNHYLQLLAKIEYIRY